MDFSKVIKVPTLYTEFSEPGSCFVNVRKQVNKKGGKEVFGWFRGDVIFPPLPLIQTWIHHCVWQSPDGRLFDITPCVTTLSEDAIMASLSLSSLFIPDENAQLSKKENGSYQSLSPLYQPLFTDPRVFQAIAFLRAADQACKDKDRKKEAYWCARAGAILGGEIDPHQANVMVPFFFDD